MQEEKKRESLGSTEAEEANNLSVNVKSDNSIWNQVILLHTRVVWKNFVIILTICLHFQLILYDISFRERTSFPPNPDDLTSDKFIMDLIYAFDVITAIIYKKRAISSSTYGQRTRPTKFLVVDIISLLPIDLIHHSIVGSNNHRVSYILGVNRLLRIYRLFTFFSATRNSVGYRSVFIRIAEFLVLLFSMTGVIVAVIINFVDMVNLNLAWLIIIEERSSYPTSEFQWCVMSYYVMMAQISGHGLAEAHPGMYSFFFIMIVFVSLWLIQAFEIAHLTDIILQRDYDRSFFHREIELTIKYLNDMEASKGTIEKVNRYYNYFWQKQGSSEFNIIKFTMYPSIFLKECALELAWDAYKHSHLFRDQPIPFLRNLAILFEREYHSPGETILKKYEWKHKLIYVVAGVVQILSEEDDRSPILSFSGGTILCESALVLGHRSLCNVIACTEVELNILDRRKFAELMLYRYRGIYRIIQSRIRFRYWKALRMATIGIALQKNKSHIISVPACTDVAWLKRTLTVMQNRHNNISRKEKKDVQLETIFATTDFRYTFANLDMLVISDDMALMTDQVCLNNGQIPWIFHPKSTVLKYWGNLVLACCFAMMLIIPTHVTQPSFQVLGFTFALNILCSVYIVDLIIISSTAIHENDTVYTNIIDIISRRMHNVSYWADIVAAFPTDWVFGMLGSNGPQTLAYCKINRLVKIYKFEELFFSLENRMIFSSYKMRVIKYTFYMAILTYFFSAGMLVVTCTNGICEPSGWLETFIAKSNEDMKGRFVFSAFLYASQLLVGVGIDIIVPKYLMEYLISIPLLIIGAAASSYIISSVTACQILAEFTKSWLRFNTMNIALTLELNELTKSTQSRVFRYLEMEWIDNNAYVRTFEREVFGTMTPKLRKELNVERFASLIKQVEFFNDMQEECVKEICSVCKLILLPPREVIEYRGSECRGMYIIERGHCQVWRNADVMPFNISKGKALYVIEMCCDLNNIFTVTTVTHVSIVLIRIKDLMHVLSHFPSERRILMKTLGKFRKSDEFARLLAIQSTLPQQDLAEEVKNKWQQTEELARTKTKQNTQDRTEKAVIFQPDDVTKKYSFRQNVFMFFLLKSTISPHGRFIKIWEVISCTCAYLLITLYSANAIVSEVTSSYLQFVLVLILNLFMVFDLYVRLHVQFYNSHKILVIHPLSTANNYIRTGMIVDIIAIFPLEYFFITQNASDLKKLWFYRMNRLLMAHRIIAALWHYYSWPHMSKRINCVMFIPMIVLIGHVFACGLVHELCQIGERIEQSEQFAKGIYCSPENVQLKYQENELITPIKMYIYSLLYVLASITRIGTVNMRPMKYTAIVYVLLLSFLGFLLLMVVTTYTISMISRRDVSLTAYQQQMGILMSYLKENKVSTEFRVEVTNYFEYFWILKRGTSIMKQMRLFPSALREDVLWCIYGPSLTKSPGFSKRNESFFRSLFSYMEVNFYAKGLSIMRLSRVHRSVYFIHSGLAEVVGPDGVRIAVLGRGSIFGNFTGSATMRQTCAIATLTHVEAIVIDSTDFFDLMMRHSETRERFLAAVALNTDYLRADCDTEVVEVGSQSKRKLSRFILLPNSALVQAWEIFSILFSCYFSVATCLYDIAVTQFSGYSLILLYVIDFAFLLKIAIVFFTAFEDDLGDYVVDKTQIARRFRESKTGLYLHIFTILPFEAFSILIADSAIRWYALAWLRINRIPRLILVVNYFRTACNRLNINISRMRLFYAAVLLISLFHGAACLMILVQKATSDEMEILEAFQIYVQRFHTVSAMFATVSSRDFPTTSWEAFYLVILFLVFYICHAVLLGEVFAVVDVGQFVMNKYERKITFFQERVSRMNLTYALKVRACSYGSKLWRLRSGQQTPQLINEAPYYLRCTVLYEIYGRHLSESNVFGKLHEDFVEQLAFHFRANLFLPGDTIVNFGDIDETMYFIHKGTILVSYSEVAFSVTPKANSNLIDTIGPGESFGLVQGLYENIPHTATYTAETTSHIVYLYRPHWMYLLQYFPDTTVNLYRTATEIMLSTGLEAHV